MRPLLLACLPALVILGPAPAADPARPAAPADQPALGVLSFEVPPKPDDPRGDLLADLVTEAVAGRYPVVDRKDLKKVLAEQELSLRGLVNAEDAVRAGKLTGARLLLAGRVFPVGDKTLAVLRVISVASGRVRGLNFSLPGQPALETIARRAGDELVKALPRLQKQLRSAPGEAPAPARSGPPVPDPARAGLDPAVVAVLNFENRGQGDARWDWLGKGLADLTIGDLAGQGLRVVSREQMQEMVHELARHKQGQDPRRVAGTLKAARCVFGVYRVANEKADLKALVLDVQTGRQVHVASASGPEGDLLALQKKLSAELADVLKGNRPGTFDPAGLPQWTDSLKASELLYQGIDRFDRGEYLDAWGLFRRALRQDPRYADALYWSGRMMYYVQEYHQARIDLERFVVEHPGHARAGDAIMEIINAAQFSAASAEEVLQVLAFTAGLAPKAEVANQFGTGYSSTVGIYTAGLASQILRRQGRYREAFERFAEQIDNLPVEHPLYWKAWHEMLALKISHLEATGEALPMPPRPRVFDNTDRALSGDLRSPGGMHPNSERGAQDTGEWAGMSLGGDEPADWTFVQLTPARPSSDFNFSRDPLRISNKATIARTFTRYFYADPQHHLRGLDVEIRYRPDPAAKLGITLMGSVESPVLPLDGSGLLRYHLPLAPGIRAAALSLRLSNIGGKDFDRWTAAVLSWKTTARLGRYEGAPGAVVLHAPDDLRFKARLDGVEVGERAWDLPGDPRLVAGAFRVENVPAGAHALSIEPWVWGKNSAREIAVPVAAGEVVEVALSASIDPRRRGRWPQPEFQDPWRGRRIDTPSDTFRTGADMGDTHGRPWQVHFFEDRAGRWVVVWSLRRDLYLTVSSDRGRTWSPAAKLPPPVNSAHDEGCPILAQDEDGRYLLAFVSDRNLERTHAVYLCWSDDLANFSAPVRVTSGAGTPLQILRHSDGGYRVYCCLLGADRRERISTLVDTADHWAMCSSTDLVHWSQPTDLVLPRPPRADAAAPEWANLPQALSVLGRQGGYVGLGLTRDRPQRLVIYTSEDGVRFLMSRAVPLASRLAPGANGNSSWLGDQLRARAVGDHLLVVVAESGARGVVLQSEGGTDGPWKQVGAVWKEAPDRAWRGDFSLTDDALYFFSSPRPFRAMLPVENYIKAFRRSDDEHPLLMLRHDYQPRPLDPNDPVAQAPPRDVEARIIQRTPKAAPAPTRPTNP